MDIRVSVLTYFCFTFWFSCVSCDLPHFSPSSLRVISPIFLTSLLQGAGRIPPSVWASFSVDASIALAPVRSDPLLRKQQADADTVVYMDCVQVRIQGLLLLAVLCFALALLTRAWLIPALSI